MRKYTDYYLTKKKKRAKKQEALTPEEMGGVQWTNFTIVVPTDDDKKELMKAFKHFHNSNINTDNIAVNQLAHEYLEGTDIIVNKKLYDSIKKQI
jgi:hypothetical protein